MEFNGEIPERLRESIRNKTCLLFVGAGISSGAKRSNGQYLPTWANLLRELLSQALNRGIHIPDESDIHILIDEDSLLEAGQAIRDAMGDALQSAFLEIFGDPALRPTKVHRDLTLLPFSGMLTTNYDALLEGACTLRGNGVAPYTFTQVDFDATVPSPLRSRTFFVLKAHGDYRRVATTVVFGTRDYQKILYVAAGYRHFMEQAFALYTILFLGYGNSDSDINEVVDKVATLGGSSFDPHYILLPEGRLSRPKRDALRRDKRLQVIEYQNAADHSQVGAFVSDLLESFLFPNQRSVLHKLRALISYRPSTKSAAEIVADYLDINEIPYSLFDSSSVVDDSDYFELQRRIQFSDRVLTVHSSSPDPSDFPIAMAIAFAESKPILPIIVGSGRLPLMFGGLPFLRWDNPSVVPDLGGVLEFVLNGV